MAQAQAEKKDGNMLQSVSGGFGTTCSPAFTLQQHHVDLRSQRKNASIHQKLESGVSFSSMLFRSAMSNTQEEASAASPVMPGQAIQ
jgi:hypothetical protein